VLFWVAALGQYPYQITSSIKRSTEQSYHIATAIVPGFVYVVRTDAELGFMGPFDSQKLIATLRKKESDNVLVFGGRCSFKLYYVWETQEVFGTNSYPGNSQAFEILDNQTRQQIPE